MERERETSFEFDGSQYVEIADFYFSILSLDSST